jgi:hypothetical protein
VPFVERSAAAVERGGGAALEVEVVATQRRVRARIRSEGHPMVAVLSPGSLTTSNPSRSQH